MKKSLKSATLAACLFIITGTATAFVSTRQACFHACSAPESYPAKCNGIAKPRKCFAFRKLVRKCMRFGVDVYCPEIVTTVTTTTVPTPTTIPGSGPVVIVVPGPPGPVGPPGPEGPPVAPPTTLGPVAGPTTTTTLPVAPPTTLGPVAGPTTTTTTVASTTTTTLPVGDHCQFNSDCPSGKCRHRKDGNVCDPR